MSLIRSLYPDRYIESNVSSKVKEKNPFLYLFIIGSVLSLVGLFVFVSLPNIMISGKYDLLLNLMSVALFCVMIGFILLGLSLLPLLIHVALLVSTPLIRNIKNFLNMSIFRHNRRNQLINLMLIFSFSMIIFTSSFITNVTNQMITQKQLKTGTSMFIKSTDKSLLPMEIKNDLMEIEGVESTSAILRTIKEDGYNYPGSTPESQDLSLSAGDLGGLSTIDIFSVAVDEDFKRTIYQDIIQMEEGDFDHAFESLFNLEHPSAIIAEKLATSLDVSLNDSIRLLFKSNQTSTETIVKITGIFHQIPGVRSIEEFGSLSQQSFDYLSEDGILVSLSLFNQGFGLTSEKDNQGYASRILVKVRENADENAVKSQIYASLSEVNIEIITTTQWISQDQNLFSAIKYGVSLLLLIFIFTAVSNLSVSAYSIFVERQAEIRSLRGIGLSIKNVEHVFFIELLILLLANGFVGVIAGGLMALTFSSLGEVVYRVKTPFTLSYDLIIILFIISISYLKLSYHRLFRQKIEMKISSNLTI
jgi:ABC-type lipoprotein release transport system permease subunit